MAKVFSKKVMDLLVITVVINIINGILIYCLSLELSSNLYYSRTQYAMLFSTCIMFIGHGLGGVIYSLFPETKEKHLMNFIKLWIIAIILTLLLIFTFFPIIIKNIHFLKMSKSFNSFLKIFIVGLIEMPVFLIEGAIYSIIFCIIKKKHPDHIAILAAFSAIGSALGYLGGIFVPRFPGINAAFIVFIIALLLIVPKKHIYNLILFVVGVSIFFINGDSFLEKYRSPINSVYAQNIKGKVIDYDWSRFQKSEYILSGAGDKEKISLTLNGALQVIISKNPRMVKNIGFDAIYQKDIVVGKDVLIIGGGMGRGAQIAYNNGAALIDVVDIEPSLITKKKVYEDYNEYIFDKENVNLIIADGRTMLHKLNRKYDLIVFEGVINAAAVYSLNITSEGYLCTSEAIEDALAILKDGGLFVDYTISSERTIESYIKKHKELPEKMKALYMYAFVDDDVASQKYYVSLSCMSTKNESLVSVEKLLSQSKNDEGITVKEYKSHIITKASSFAISDDRPFPHVVARKSVRFMIIWTMIFVSLCLIVISFGIKKKCINNSFYLFSLLGAGMMMMELFLINKSNFFLDDSVLSYAIISIVFLFAFSVGNAKSLRFNNIHALAFLSLFIIFLVLPVIFFNTDYRLTLIKYPLFLRIILVTIIISPIAFLCGSFFPRLLHKHLPEDEPNKAMGYVMLLDALGVGVGFFLFNYIGIVKGYNYSIPFIIIIYSIISLCSLKNNK